MSPTSARNLTTRLLRLLLGYTPQAGVPSLRSAKGVLLIAGSVAVFIATIVLLREQPAVGIGDVRVLMRLDEYTRSATDAVENTIPGFLQLRGRLGALVNDSAGTVVLQDIDESDLRSGFCTASLPRLVRQIYPGTYDALPDAVLEKRVLATHPEYGNRLCTLLPWMPPPEEIVKYEVEPRAAPLLSLRAAGWGIIAMLLFGLAASNAYYRLPVVRSAKRFGTP